MHVNFKDWYFKFYLAIFFLFQQIGVNEYDKVR